MKLGWRRDRGKQAGDPEESAVPNIPIEADLRNSRRLTDFMLESIFITPDCLRNRLAQSFVLSSPILHGLSRKSCGDEIFVVYLIT